MVVLFALLGALLLGLLGGLAWRGCLVLGDRRRLGLHVQALLIEQQIDQETRATLAAMREAARHSMRSTRSA